MWIAGLALALAACVPKGELEPRHASSGVATPLPSAEFGAYVEAARGHIQVNGATDRPLAPDVIEDRAPFELVPDAGRCPKGQGGRHPKAALLIHDLGGTPYRMRDLGRRLADDCYLVRAILLPGHGTVPGDLLEVDAGAWVEATRLGGESLAGTAERVVLVGFGAGATLAIHDASLETPPGDPDLSALVLLAPALETRAAKVTADQLYGELVPEARWSRLLPDSDPVAYESMPRNAERQLDRLIDRLGPAGPLELPTFVAISAADATVDPLAARRWFCRELIGPRQLIWYGAEPGVGPDCRFVIVRSSELPGIVDLSHIALPVAPDNPRYGAAGSYVDCLHYYWEEDTPNWLICLDPTKTPENYEVRYGEVSTGNLQRHVMRRLTYHPDFDAMVDDMLAFLDGLE